MSDVIPYEHREWVSHAKARGRVVVTQPGRPDRLGTLVFAGPNGGKCHVQVGAVKLTVPRARIRLVLEPGAVQS